MWGAPVVPALPLGNPSVGVPTDHTPRGAWGALWCRAVVRESLARGPAPLSCLHSRHTPDTRLGDHARGAGGPSRAPLSPGELDGHRYQRPLSGNRNLHGEDTIIIVQGVVRVVNAEYQDACLLCDDSRLRANFKAVVANLPNQRT